jgi:hypothetical protein
VLVTAPTTMKTIGMAAPSAAAMIQGSSFSNSVMVRSLAMRAIGQQAYAIQSYSLE